MPIIDTSGATFRGIEAGLQTSPWAAALRGGYEGYRESQAIGQERAESEADRAQRQQGLDIDAEGLALRQQQMEAVQQAQMLEQQQIEAQQQQDQQAFTNRVERMVSEGAMDEREGQALLLDAQMGQVDMEKEFPRLRDRYAQHIQQQTNAAQIQERIKVLPPEHAASGAQLAADFEDGLIDIDDAMKAIQTIEKVTQPPGAADTAELERQRRRSEAMEGPREVRIFDAEGQPVMDGEFQLSLNVPGRFDGMDRQTHQPRSMSELIETNAAEAQEVRQWWLQKRRELFPDPVKEMMDRRDWSATWELAQQAGWIE